MIVEHKKLFETEFEYNDVGTLRPTARKILERLKARGETIVIGGPITETRAGRVALLSALYDHDLPFDEILNA